jgi:hypothetical protein
MLQKAVRVQASKDPGTLAPSADFVLLSSLPDDRLLAVASDSGVALLPGVGSVGDLISLVKPKNLPRLLLRKSKRWPPSALKKRTFVRQRPHRMRQHQLVQLMLLSLRL